MKIGVLIVAYNAQDTLTKVLDRIPKDFAPRIDSILVCDDASTPIFMRLLFYYGQKVVMSALQDPRSSTAPKPSV